MLGFLLASPVMRVILCKTYKKAVMAYLKSIKDYAQMLQDAHSKSKMPEGYKYRGYSDLLLQHAERMNTAKEVPHDLIHFLSHTRIKECFRNCQLVCMATDWNYCEGLAMPKDGILPVLHAWLEKDGVVYDPTWCPDRLYRVLRKPEAVHDRVNKNHHQNVYFGVRLNKALVAEQMFETSMAVSVLDDYLGDYPIYKEDGAKWFLDAVPTEGVL